MSHLEKDLCPKQLIHGTTEFGMHQNTITSHCQPPHNNASFSMGMHGKGLLMYPGKS
jgi:hypothetical protein